MKTVCVQIGNSDDKLSQARWSHFVTSVALRIGEIAHHVHFAGGSGNSAPWQNSAWVFEIKDWQRTQLKSELARVGKEFNQDSVAWLEGETEFLKREL